MCEGSLGEEPAKRAAALDLDERRAAVDSSGARFVVPGDEEWPDRLCDLAGLDPVQRRGGVPLGLWLRGPGHLTALVERSVAIVGSRAATAYGNGVAADLAADLADTGVTVVSGGAFGIDAAAHRGALAVEGPSVSVVANGVDVAYPPGNARIFEALAARHLVVSELPPGSHPTRVRFLIRTSTAEDMHRCLRRRCDFRGEGSRGSPWASRRGSRHALSAFQARAGSDVQQQGHR